MKSSSLALVALGALALAGCETLNGPQAYANAEAQRYDCKATVVTNTPEAMRLQNDPNAQTDQMKQSEGTLALGKIKQNEPRALLQGRNASEESLTSKTLRGC
jgi:hypothetical protein